jgi:hypothetical protein
VKTRRREALLGQIAIAVAGAPTVKKLPYPPA